MRFGRPIGDFQAIRFKIAEMAARIEAGYTTDFAVERHLRDARLTKIFEGASEIQLRIISDGYLPRPAPG